MTKKPVADTAPGTVASPSEKRSFRMHPALLYSVMVNQAGTLSKSLLEAVMNSIDAGASYCKVDMTGSRVVIADDGKGFVGMEEIENFFETFGQPHVEGDATYGRFRMGRGQLFAFGKNRWCSNTFVMDVDIKPQKDSVASEGLGYHFSTGPQVDGCRIELDLYDKLLPSAVDNVLRETAKYVKYAQIPIIVNGKQINTPPQEQEWSHDTPEAYIDLKERGSLDVYNLGVLVRQYPAYQFGTGGTVVSKRQLDVNFARNEVVSSCPVFKKIGSFIRKQSAATTVAKKKRLNGDEWEAFANDVRTGEKPLVEALESPPLVRLVTGTMITLGDLADRCAKFHDKVAATKAKDMTGDRLMQRGLALVIDEETFARFGYDGIGEFIAGISALAKKAEKASVVGDWSVRHAVERLANLKKTVEIIPPEDFGKYIRSDYDEIDPKTLKPAEKFALKIMQYGGDNIAYALGSMLSASSPDRHHWHVDQAIKKYTAAGCQALGAMFPGKDRMPRREIRVGMSDCADAWTDGEHRIWIHRRHLPLVSKGVKGFAKLGSLMLHEYLHGNASMGDGNIHDEQFYEMHHDLCIDTPILGEAIDAMANKAIREIRQEQRRPTGALKRFEDQFAEMEMAGVSKAEPEAEVADASIEAPKSEQEQDLPLAARPSK